MTTNRKIVQLSLISIGLFLIIATYFFYPKIIENKTRKEKAVIDDMFEIEDADLNTFENVEYKGVYDFDKPFTVQSKKAYILKKDSDVVYMTNMRVTLKISDVRNIIITSDKGRYNKVTYDCFFENNVKAVDGKTIVFAENIDLLSTEDTATVYNDVFLTNDKGTLRADKVDYNFETKYYKVSMFNDEKVKIKLIE